MFRSKKTNQVAKLIEIWLFRFRWDNAKTPISDNVSTINSNHIVNQCKSDRLLMIVCRESAIGLGYGSCGAKVREQFEYCLNMISCLVNSCVLCFFQSTASISVRSFRQGQISAGSVGVISCSRWGVFLDAIGERCR